MKRDLVDTLFRVLIAVYTKGFMTQNDLKKMLGSTARRDKWLNEYFFHLNLLESKVEKIGRKEVKYYKLTIDGFKVLEVLLNHKVFEALCMTMGTWRFRECLLIKAEQISKLVDLTKTPSRAREEGPSEGGCSCGS